MKTLALATAAVGLAFTASPGLAAGDDVPSTTVSLEGLDLDSPEGQRMLDQRIDRAARQICGVDNVRTGTRIRSRSVRECYAKARTSAERQVATIIQDQQRGG